MAVLFGILFLLIIVLFFILVDQLHDRSDKKKLKTLEAFIPIYEATFDDFRKMNHDFVNHMHTLELMKDNPSLYNRDTDIKNYMEKVESAFNFNQTSAMQSSFIMMFLCSWMTRFQSAGIALEIGESIKTSSDFDGAYDQIISLNDTLQFLLEKLSSLPDSLKYIHVDEKRLKKTRSVRVSLKKGILPHVSQDLNKFVSHRSRNFYQTFTIETAEPDAVVICMR